MEGQHFVQWDYQDQDGYLQYLDTSGGSANLDLPNSPSNAHAEIFGDHTNLPGSPRYSKAPSSPGLTRTSNPLDPYGHVTGAHHAGAGEWQRDQLVRLVQAKVVLLGSVAAGKTSLLNTLRYGESHLVEAGPDGRTIGIEVHSVALQPDTKLWFYDFGGHDTYHFSQQLFLTQRAIYLLAVDVSIYDPVAFKKTLSYWYTILTSRLVAPVICLLATHIDLCVDKEAMARNCHDMHNKLISMETAHRETLEKELQMLKKEIMADNSDDAERIRKFQPRTLRQPMQRLSLLLTNRPKVFRSVCCISSKTLEGIHQFRENLVSIVTENEALFPQKDVPGSWIELSDAIVSKKENTPFVTIEEFIDLANQFDIVGDHVQQVLAYLQSVGLVLHYQDYRQNSDLSKYVFVNPNLLLAIFGLVFNHNYFMDETRFVWKHQSILRLPPFDFLHLRKNLKERGIIGEKLLKCFWDAMGISDDVYHAIVPLLEKFDLCYEIRIKPGDAVVKGRHFLFPYLLNKKKPQEVNFMWSDDLLENFMQCGVELCFTQSDLPFGFLEKVLIRAHTYVDHCLSWKKGMVAFCDEGQDLIRIEAGVDSHGKASLTVSARVRVDRMSMARHIILLLVAVTNRVLLHHYPGIVAYWYCQCAHCLVKSLKQKYSELKIDYFPADNIVYSSPNDTTQVQCVNCAPGQALLLDEVFPRETDDIHNLKRLMSEPCCRALKTTAPTLIRNMNYRDVMNALLRKQLLNIKQAEVIGSKPNNEERAQQLLLFMMQSDQKGFDVLCDELNQNDKTTWLAEELRVKSAGGKCNNLMKGRDSDSMCSGSPLRGASAGWRGSQASQGSVANTSISNWSTYSQTSYGATGSYIRRPYGSYIVREPVQNYKRSSSVRSTPQQPRKDPATVSLSRTSEPTHAPTAVMSREVVSQTREVPVTEKSYLAEYASKIPNQITEFAQEEFTKPVTRRPYRQVPVDDVTAPLTAVEVATTSWVQKSVPQTHEEEPSITCESNVDSYIVPQLREPDQVGNPRHHHLFADEPDIGSDLKSRRRQEPIASEPMRTLTYSESISEPLGYTHLSHYETDLDGDPLTDYRQSNGTYYHQVYQREQVPDVHTHSEEVVQSQPKQTMDQQQLEPRSTGKEKSQLSQHQEFHNTKEHAQYEPNHQHKSPRYEAEQQASEVWLQQDTPTQQQKQEPASSQPPQESEQQTMHQLQQQPQRRQQPQLQDRLQQHTEHPNQYQYQEREEEMQRTSKTQPTQHAQPQHQRLWHQNEHAQHESQGHAEQQAHEWPTHSENLSQQLPSQHAQRGQGRPHQRIESMGDDDKLDPASMRYKEADLTGYEGRHQMPHDLRVRSTGDILGRVRQEYTQHPSAGGGHGDTVSNERGRPKSRHAAGLIGSADLGPTHVLQDMEPIALPLKPMKRSRSSSLNQSLRRSKSKSPSKGPEQDRPNTWAVPYNWEQHNSMESLNRACPSRQSGGFIFSASTIDVKGSVKRQTSSPAVIYSSQPSLDEGRYSIPRPTGKKLGMLPQHDYVEPLPLPENLIISQSAPVKRRQPSGVPLVHRPPLSDAMQAQISKAQQPEKSSRMGSIRNNLQSSILPSHPMVQQVRQSEMLKSTRLSDDSEATESFHTGRSRISSNESDDATITSDISELTIESFHTTRSHTPSIASRALSQGSFTSDRSAGSFHNGRSHANSDIPDDVTITSDVSELTLESFHTFNSGMTLTSANNMSPNDVCPMMALQISDATLNSFRSCRLSDDEVTLTDGSSSPLPFAIDDTPNKIPMRISTITPFSQPHSQQGLDLAQGASSGPPSGPPPPCPPGHMWQPPPQHRQFVPQSEENAPPVPPRKDLMNRAPPIPARPANAPPAAIPQQRARVTFADESHGQEELRMEQTTKCIKQARTIPLPRTDPQESPPTRPPASTGELENKQAKKSKKKKEKKSKRTLLPYVGTTSEHDRAVRVQPGDRHPQHGEEQQQRSNPGLQSTGPSLHGTNMDDLLLNNNAPTTEMRKDVLQNYYFDPAGPQQVGARMHGNMNQQVYTVHAQAHHAQAQGLHDHPKPHAYVQPYMRGVSGPGEQWLDSVNSNNGGVPSTDDGWCEEYPYKGGTGNGIGIVLVEQPYTSNREANGNTASSRQPAALQQPSLRHPPRGGAAAASRVRGQPSGAYNDSGSNQRTLDPAEREGLSVERNSTASSSQDTPVYAIGSHDTAV